MMYNFIVMAICIMVLSACQTTNETFESISSGVRLVTTYEDAQKTKVIGKKIQMEDPVHGWMEAKKTTSGTYEFTAKGMRLKQDAADMEAGAGC